MHSVLWLSLPVACAVALLFSGYRRWARQKHDLQTFRNRIMFGTSTGATDEPCAAVRTRMLSLSFYSLRRGCS